MGEINNYKKTEKALYDYKYLKGYIELRKQDLAELQYQGVSATRLSKVKSSNSTKSNPVVEEFERVERMRTTWEEEIKKKEKFLCKIDYAISLLEEYGKKIIEMRYKKSMKYDEIAKFLGYSKRQIIRINKKNIEKISIVLFGIN